MSWLIIDHSDGKKFVDILHSIANSRDKAWAYGVQNVTATVKYSYQFT